MIGGGAFIPIVNSARSLHMSKVTTQIKLLDIHRYDQNSILHTTNACLLGFRKTKLPKQTGIAQQMSNELALTNIHAIAPTRERESN
jgi:hypothetical protein